MKNGQKTSLITDFPRFRLSSSFVGSQFELVTTSTTRRQLQSTLDGSGSGSVLPEIPSASTIGDVCQDITLKLQEDLNLSDSTLRGYDSSDVIRPFPLRVNGREDVTVTHIVSPSEFYVVTKKGNQHFMQVFKCSISDLLFL